MTTSATRKSGKFRLGAKPLSRPGRRTRRRQPSALLALERDLVALGKSVPPEEWAKLPRDFNENLDHYLYGSPRKTPRKA